MLYTHEFWDLCGENVIHPQVDSGKELTPYLMVSS